MNKKKKNLLANITLILIITVLFISCIQNEQENQDASAQGTTVIQEHAEKSPENYPYEEISAQEKEALDLALQDEYKARGSYAGIISAFGPQKPFVNIINAEQKHVEELVSIYTKYNLSIPKDKYRGLTAMIPTLADACRFGIDAERENIALYDTLLEDVDNQDIQATFTTLQKASQEKHLPAFERCGGTQ